MKRLIISHLICCSYLTNCHAQTPSSNTRQEIYEYAEEMPNVKGGRKALLKAITNGVHIDNKSYKAKSYNIMIRFIVTEQGEPIRIMIIDNPFDDNVLEQVTSIIKSFKWSPVSQNNVIVPVLYKLPVKLYPKE